MPGASRRSATKSSKNARKGKKGKNSQLGRGPSQPRTPAGFPPGAFGPGGPAALPPGLPPGMEMPDLSKLNLPKK